LPTATASGPSTATSTLLLPTLTQTPSPNHITLTVLYDNNAYDNRLETDWGFACLVEGLEKTILFDTGGDGQRLMRNMRTLGRDPHDIDVVVISHNHGDHLGGLRDLLSERPDVMVYAPQSFSQGVKQSVTRAGAELVEVDGPIRICEHVSSTGELGDGIKEQALVIETSQGLVVITGCAHPGIVKVIRRAKDSKGEQPYLALGGFHLGGASETAIQRIVDDFQRLGVQRVAPCHCSGEPARRLFEAAYGERFILTGVGSQLRVEN
jgi:7,8-dihydropterin-6-yl-methyl-4-(beta-D-ribofuranosyl)aminobenzene 5'-phosphate synthase